MNKLWKVNKKPPKKFLEQFPEYSPLVLQLLWDRGLKNQKEIDEFFSPDFDQDIHDPFLMKGMKETVKRIKKAVKNKEKITIFGDYDADGVCGTAILSKMLKKLGVSPDIYIPDRNKEGYGLNPDAVKEAALKKTKLIITIDCGVSDFEEVKLANKLGMDVIIVDHHEIPGKIPLAFSVINPCQKGEKYPFKELAAAGVAFKLAQALISDSKFIKWLLDLVALATVADMMPLLGENRTLVKYGLVVLAQTKRPGLKELMKIAGVKPFFDSKLFATNLDTYTLGYVLGPRLNAAGRMDHATTAYELLVTESQKEAEDLARRLNERNKERQGLMWKIIDKVSKRLEKKDIKKEKMIFEGDKDWPVGMVGLIAGQIADKFYCPAFMFQKQKNRCVGSVRSIPCFNVVEAISKCKEFLEDFGGHAGAAGFTVLNKNLEKFKKALLKIAKKEIKDKDLTPVLDIDTEVDAGTLNWELYDETKKFAPFGQENQKPLFLMKNLRVAELRTVGNSNNHLKLNLTKTLDDGRIKGFWAIGFGLGSRKDKIQGGDKIDVVFELIVNEWNGTRELQLKVLDLKLSKS